MVYETRLRSDLMEGVRVVQLKGNMFTMDNRANKIIAEVYSNGEPVTLDQTKSITAYMVRPDKKTVIVGTAGAEEYVVYEGTNAVALTLPPNAYGKEGQLSIVIKHDGITVGACTVYVYKTSTDVWIDPEGEIPSIDELEQMLSEYAETNAAAQKVANMTVTAEAASGSTPSVEKTMIGQGDQEHVNLNFKLVKGETGNTGATGATPQLSVGTVTDVPYGTGASVTITGTAENPVLNFSLQAGQSGNETIDDTKGLGDTDFVWSADKTDKEIISLEGRKANTTSVADIKTASGDIVEVSDALGEAVKQMQINIAPLQDLHGYDHPWVGGAGKNLIKMTVSGIKSINTSGSWSGNAYTLNSVVFTILTDDGDNVTGIKVNGTNSSSSAMFFYLDSARNTYPSDTLAVTTGASNATTSTYYLTDSYGGAFNTGVSATFTHTTQTITPSIRINGNVAVSNDTFQPMIRVSTASSDYEPYTNICPVSGWTGAKVTARKKNLLPKFGSEWVTGTTESYYAAKTSDSTPTFPFTFGTSGSSSYTGVPVYVLECKPSTTYTIKPPTGTKPIVSEYATLAGITSKSNALARWTDNTTGYSTAITKTTNASAKYLVVSFSAYSASASVTVNENTVFQLEEGSSATTFEAFANHYSITFPSAAGTVYGGTLTVNDDGTGTVAVDKLTFTLNGTETWASNGTEGSTNNYYYTPITLSNNKFVTDDIISNMYSVANISGSSTAIGITCLYSNARTSNAIYCRPYNITTTTVSAFRTYLESNNLQVVCGIETPIVYTLTTDQVLHLLNGYNVVYADCGDISFDYYTDKYAHKDYAEHTEHFKANSDSQYVYKEASGSVIEIADGAGDYAKQVQIGIEPVQDLHGFASPWVGGAGKNLIPVGTLSSLGGTGLTATLNDDGTVKITGTASENSFYGWSFLIKANTYIINGCPDKTGCSMSLRNSVNGTILWSSTVTGDTSTQFTVSSDTTCWVSMRVESGTALGTDGVVYKPMVRLSTVTDSTFAPYSNICPISGWDKAEVTITGKNICEGFLDGYNVGITNIEQLSGYCVAYARVKKGRTYTASHITSNQAVYGFTETLPAKNVVLYNGRTVVASVDHCTATAPVDGYFVVRDTNQNHTIMIELGSEYSATTVPFVANDTYSIAFPSSAGTVYGGTLIVNQDGTGSLVVDKAMVDMGSLTWIYNSSFRTSTIDGNIARPSDNTTVPDVICSCYKVMEWGSTDDFSVYVVPTSLSATSVLRIADSRYSTASDFQTAVTGQTLVYRIASPSTYTLTTDQVLHLLSGYNTVYSDCGETTIFYPSEKYLTLDQAERERIHESDSVSASVKTISDGADNAPMGMKIAVEPIQDLHGYSNPWVGGAGKNKLPVADSITISSITFTKDANGYITASPSNSDARTFSYENSQYKTKLPAGSYTLVVDVKTASTNSNNSIQMYDSSNNQISVSGYNIFSSTGVKTRSITLESETNVGLCCKFYDGSARMMIVLSTESDTSYAPYENLCPILGWDKAEVTRTGKNLATTEVEKRGYTIFSTGEGQNSTTTNYIITKPILLAQGKSYREIYTRISGTDPLRVGYYDSNLNFINRENFMSSGTALTVPSSAKYLKLSYKVVDAEMKDFQIEEGSTATTYEPFGTVYTIPFRSTMYGGYITVGKDGEVVATATSAMIVLDGTGTYSIQSSKYCYYEIDSMKRIQDYSVIKCDKLKSVTNHVDMINNNSFGITGYYNTTQYAGQNWFYFYIDGLTTANAYKDWMAEHKPVVVYPLATPVTVRLNPCTIRSLLGTNNIWADTGNIQEVKWSADVKSYIDSLFNSIIPAQGNSF